MPDFDPANHRMIQQQRWFEDFVLGERFVLPSRTQTSAIFAAFQTASGDTHPVHYDVEYCRARGMPNLLAHGFQTLIHTAPGAGLFPFLVEDSLVGFLEQSSRFLKPVYAEDTLYPALDVVGLSAGRTTGVVTLRSTVFNQRRELVLEGMQTFLLRTRPPQVAQRPAVTALFCRCGVCKGVAMLDVKQFILAACSLVASRIRVGSRGTSTVMRWKNSSSRTPRPSDLVFVT